MSKTQVERYHEALERWHDAAASMYEESQQLLDRRRLDDLEAEAGDRIRRAVARLLPVVGSMTDELMGELEQLLPRTRDSVSSVRPGSSR